MNAMHTSTKHPLYLSAAVTIDVIVFTIENDQLKVVLIKRSDEPFRGDYALPGGFLQKSETTHQAALRILNDKAGVSDVFVEQLYTFDDVDRDPRGQIVSIAYFALVPPHQLAFKSGALVQEPALLSTSELPKLAFDHRKMIDYAVGRLRSKLEYTNVIYSLLPRLFTLTQLQRTYEIILNKPLDKRNFRKKYLSLGLIESTNQKLEGTRYRPAELYRFKSHKPVELQRWF